MSIRLVTSQHVSSELRNPPYKAYIATMRDRIEYESAMFLYTHRERVLGEEDELRSKNKFTTSIKQLYRNRMLRTRLEQLERTYNARVNELLTISARVQHLRRSLGAVHEYRAKSKCRLGWNRHFVEIKGELECREAEEKEILESIYEVAVEIAELGCA
ncbi:uncharacterized protein FOMMEDRAFT_152761 [Fomitiporia mediterranea MF3/22]|uniref:uncharacterized protein n=1 Tax=Fomitiporia mediterranea (strain MF3/22) TaxID=694068 RepID=UPI0004407816|nr:uncharacterized protein FOMMEDRAFT_152761 [Fomitiporia mediterranea MF3/22]EJD05451.1 hypothetical protein FOMMEDRAFT_152761 [Fomitiporia mediterranea MF3/22]